MKFYIVTPTFNALSWLQNCIRSVADQVEEGVEVHHHVQDGGSSDGTPGWLQQWQAEHDGIAGYTFTYESGKDAGMYDALNKAWEKLSSDADITAHLNSDEQYLPSALKGVAEAFLRRPEADIVVTSYIVLDVGGRYICHRRPITPWKWCTQVVCEIITCACFHRVKPFIQHGIRFDTRFRSIADMVMYRDIVNCGVRVCAEPSLITSAFTVTGDNLGWSEVTDREWKVVYASMPAYAERVSWMIDKISSARRRFVDVWYSVPKSYALYLSAQEHRVRFEIKNPTSHWGCRSVAQ